jgi:hypothetical protein
MRRLGPRLVAGLVGLMLSVGCGGATAPPPLVQERAIPLPQAAGRIDHLTIDEARGRLFVAELGAGAVEALDLASGRSLGRVTGLQEPQGVGYLPGRDELAVATGGDGMLRFYRTADLAQVGAIKLGEDADNVRIDPQTGRVLVGYGRALAVVDPAARRVIANIPLPAHPEAFQIRGGRVIVNLPQAGAVAVLDLASGREIARWRNPGPHFNYPMALDGEAGLVAAVYRLPARLVLFSLATGHAEQQLATCGDADDVDFDARRTRLYVVCGEGAVEAFPRSGSGFSPAGRLATRRGARTGLYSPRLDRLFVAARAQGGQPAAILVLRPH